MKKRVLSIVLVVLMVMSALSMSAFAAVTTGIANDEGTATWSFDDKTGVLTVSGSGYVENYNDWVNPIRDSIKAIVIEEGITELYSSVFENCTNLETVTFADSVISLGGYLFLNCTKLTSVTLPANLEYYDWVFVGCTSLADITISEQNEYFKTVDGVLYNKDMTELYVYSYAKPEKSFTVPDTVKYIHDEAFFDCDAIETVVLPESIEEISYYVFAECDNLKNIDISNVKILREGAFNNCDKIENVKLNKDLEFIEYQLFNDCDALKSIDMSGMNLEYIGYEAFYSCDALEEIKMPDSVEYLWSTAFVDTAYYNNASNWENGVLYNGQYAVLLDYNATGVVTFKEGTTQIADEFAYAVEGITAVEFPDSLRKIGDFAFYECINLENITIPDTIEQIGGHVFENTKDYMNPDNWQNDGFYIGKWLLNINNNESLTEFTVKDGTVYIAGGVAEYNQYLKKVTIPASVKGIGNYAFSECYNLETVVLSKGLETIGRSAFFYCDMLEDINLPDTLKKIDEDAFNSCYSLKNVTLLDGLEYIGSDAFNDCESFTEISVPDSVKHMGTSVFEDCINLVSAKLPVGLLKIPSDTFKDCYELKEITLPSAFTAIGNEAFEETAIESITLPYTLKSIANDAFYDCLGLKKVIFLGTKDEWDAIDIDPEDNEYLLEAELSVIKLVDTSVKFKDVKKDAWYKEYVDYAVTHEMFNGTSDTTFEPNASMTRGMFVTVLSRIAGADIDNNAKTKFADVPAGKYFTGAVAWAVENEIVLGVSDTEFAPDKDVTREQMCTLLVRYAEYADITLEAAVEKITFADESKISDYAKLAVDICQKAGIVNGKSATEFAPKESATRAQVAKILTVFIRGFSNEPVTATAFTEIKSEHETLIGTAARYDGVTFMTGEDISNESVSDTAFTEIKSEHETLIGTAARYDGETFMTGEDISNEPVSDTAFTEIKSEHETLIGTAARYDGVTFMTGDSIK